MDIVLNDLILAPDQLFSKPGITSWHRLEGDPTALDLAPGLEARLADPLWLIGRQWQLGELQGEDAGSPILTQLTGQTSRLFLQGTPPADHPADAIWEPHVEAEADAILAYATLSGEAGLDLERCLVAEGAASLIPGLRLAFPLTLPTADNEDFQQNLLRELWRDAAPDGADLLNRIRPLRDDQGQITALPAGFAAGEALYPAALRAVTQWLAEWDGVFVPPMATPTWDDRRLEYRFDIDTDTAHGRLLHVDGYADARLDWWAMDFGAPATGPFAEPRSVSAKRIPLPIRFAGMPADRYFEAEDTAVNLPATTGGPTSIATMLMLEYMLAASTDWFHIPLSLDYGHSFTLDQLTVTDTFGRTAVIPPAQSGKAKWSMFDLSLADDPQSSDNTFVLPAVTAQTLESDPIEEVAFFRDEMANIVWATERVTPGIGAAARPSRAESRVMLQTLDVTGLTDAAYLYRMQTPVPLNWHPMVAVPDPAAPLGTILFRRMALRRTLQDGRETDGLPKGLLLRGTDNRFEVAENEIPRSGIVLTRSFQMARTGDGRRLVWLGRTKRAGRGEGSSGLRFDALSPVEKG